jgi:hypothetical protein
MKLQIIIFLLLIFTANCKNNPEYKTCDSFQLKTSNEFLADVNDHQIINTIVRAYHYNIDFAHLGQISYNRIHIKSLDDFPNWVGGELSEVVTEIPQELYNSFQLRNDTIYSFDHSHISSPIEMLPNEEIECLLDEPDGSWRCYYNKYPGSRGIFNFSRIGINSTGNKAIVEYSFYSGGVAGVYYFVVLAKVQGVWVAEEQIRLYRS